VLASQARQQKQTATSNLSANIYLPTEALKPIFQDQISQQVTGLTNGMMNNMFSGLPSADQGWARAMAGTLIQPSATLLQVTPQQNGLATSMSLSMYPGDPKPVNASMLVTLSARDASTIQVSAQPVPGSPQLANGPLTTFGVPVGQLTSINATPGCGGIALNANIQVPIAFNSTQANTQSHSSQVLSEVRQSQVVRTNQNKAGTALNAYVEIPNSSLSALGRSIGPIKVGEVPFSNPLTAENMNISTQGNGLVITAGIFTEPPLHPQVATFTAFVQASAENGQLVMTVTKVDVKVAGISLPNGATDSYKQQIQTLLNNNLGNMLAGKFTVDSVSVGGGANVPCAAADSLMLQGATNIG
jgi:hypothetical protein